MSLGNRSPRTGTPEGTRITSPAPRPPSLGSEEYGEYEAVSRLGEECSGLLLAISSNKSQSGEFDDLLIGVKKCLFTRPEERKDLGLNYWISVRSGLSGMVGKMRAEDQDEDEARTLVTDAAINAIDAYLSENSELDDTQKELLIGLLDEIKRASTRRRESLMTPTPGTGSIYPGIIY